MVDGELRLEGKDDPAFELLIARYQETLGGPPKGLPPDRRIELVLETGDAPMPRSRPLKRLSAGELEELRAQVNQLLDYSWIRHSTRFTPRPSCSPVSRTTRGGSATTTGG